MKKRILTALLAAMIFVMSMPLTAMAEEEPATLNEGQADPSSASEQSNGSDQEKHLSNEEFSSILVEYKRKNSGEDIKTQDSPNDFTNLKFTPEYKDGVLTFKYSGQATNVEDLEKELFPKSSGANEIQVVLKPFNNYEKVTAVDGNGKNYDPSGSGKITLKANYYKGGALEDEMHYTITFVDNDTPENNKSYDIVLKVSYENKIKDPIDGNIDASQVTNDCVIDVLADGENIQRPINSEDNFTCAYNNADKIITVTYDGGETDASAVKAALSPYENAESKVHVKVAAPEGYELIKGGENHFVWLSIPYVDAGGNLYEGFKECTLRWQDAEGELADLIQYVTVEMNYVFNDKDSGNSSWWTAQPKMTLNDIEIEVPNAIKDGVSYILKDGVLTFYIDELSQEQWKNAVIANRNKGDQLRIEVRYIVPQGTTHWAQGDSENEPNERFESLGLREYEGNGGDNGYSYAQAIESKDGSKVTVIPLDGNTMYVSRAWLVNDTRINRYLKIVFSYKGDSELFVIDNPLHSLNNVSEGQINSVASDTLEYSELDRLFDWSLENGVLTFTYVGEKTTIGDIKSELKIAPGPNKKIEVKLNPPSEVSGNKTKSVFLVYGSGGKLVEPTTKEVVDWGNGVKQAITLKMDYKGKNGQVPDTWLDIGRTPVPESRIEVVNYVNGKNKPTTAGGMHIDIGATGKEINVWFDGEKKIDVDDFKNATILITPPAGATKVKSGSGTSGSGISLNEDAFIRSESTLTDERNPGRLPTDSGVPMMPIGGINPLEALAVDEVSVDGIKIWFAKISGGGTSVTFDWYNDSNERISREYIYITYDPYINMPKVKQSASAPEEDEITLLGDNMSLIFNVPPQEGKDNLYVELEAIGKLPENGTNIVIPYSFIRSDLTYDEVVEKDMEFVINHYLDEEYEKKEEIYGAPTEDGIVFKTYSFSPFTVSALTDDYIEDENEEDRLEREPTPAEIERDRVVDEIKEAVEQAIFGSVEVESDSDKKSDKKDESKSGSKDKPIVLDTKKLDNVSRKISKAIAGRDIYVTFEYNGVTYTVHGLDVQLPPPWRIWYSFETFAELFAK